MAGEYWITIYLGDDKLAKLDDVGLTDQVVEVKGRKALQVPFTRKDHKKLTKTFPDLTFDETNACVLPSEAEDMLFNMIVEAKTIDVMKIYIMKAYNPLAGKEIRSRVH